jgi:protein-S-isoprenylcysteine O-methyltransferase Ste14
MIEKSNRKIIWIPPTYFYLAIIIIMVTYFLLPQYNIIAYPYNLLGVILIILWWYFIISPYYLFRAKNTPEKFEKSTCVVTEWLYKYSRNPMYLWSIILLIWLALLSWNIISFISPIFLFLFLNFMFIPYEEEKWEKELWKQYLDYKKKVRRWL